MNKKVGGAARVTFLLGFYHSRIISAEFRPTSKKKTG